MYAKFLCKEFQTKRYSEYFLKIQKFASAKFLAKFYGFKPMVLQYNNNVVKRF